METSNPSPNSRGNLRNNPTDPTDRWGDVDRYGDLVDELEHLIPSESPIDAHAHARNIVRVVEHARMMHDLLEQGRLFP